MKRGIKGPFGFKLLQLDYMEISYENTVMVENGERRARHKANYITNVNVGKLLEYTL